MTRVRPLWLALCGVAFVCSGCSTRWEPQITEIPSPAAAIGASEPQLTAFAGHAILSWIERSGETASLKFSERTANGWTAPQQVASGDNWFVNWADVPSVVRVSDHLLAAHWLQTTTPDGEAYDVRIAFSRDDGKTWSAATSPHHDGTQSEHGFASLYPAADGGLGLVWLDGRDADRMAVRSATFAPDGSQTSETLVRDRACECCPTAAVPTSDGAIAAYRNLGDHDVRDIYVARFTGGKWTAPVPVHNDGWRVESCPINGPAIAANGRVVAVAWFNAKDDQGHTFVAFSNDGGQTFGDAMRADDASSLGRVGIVLLDDGSAAVAWLEFVDGRAQLRLRHVTAAGARSASTTLPAFTAGRANGYPRIVGAGRELIFAWAESQDGTTRVRTAAWKRP
jgi:hypothetical protein